MEISGDGFIATISALEMLYWCFQQNLIRVYEVNSKIILWQSNSKNLLWISAFSSLFSGVGKACPCFENLAEIISIFLSVSADGKAFPIITTSLQNFIQLLRKAEWCFVLASCFCSFGTNWTVSIYLFPPIWISWTAYDSFKTVLYLWCDSKTDFSQVVYSPPASIVFVWNWLKSKMKVLCCPQSLFAVSQSHQIIQTMCVLPEQQLGATLKIILHLAQAQNHTPSINFIQLAYPFQH